MTAHIETDRGFDKELATRYSGKGSLEFMLAAVAKFPWLNPVRFESRFGHAESYAIKLPSGEVFDAAGVCEVKDYFRRNGALEIMQFEWIDQAPLEKLLGAWNRGDTFAADVEAVNAVYRQILACDPIYEYRFSHIAAAGADYAAAVSGPASITCLAVETRWQDHGSTNDQLIELADLGNRQGLYDAVDALKLAFPKVFAE